MIIRTITIIIIFYYYSPFISIIKRLEFIPRQIIIELRFQQSTNEVSKKWQVGLGLFSMTYFWNFMAFLLFSTNVLVY